MIKLLINQVQNPPNMDVVEVKAESKSVSYISTTVM